MAHQLRYYYVSSSSFNNFHLISKTPPPCPSTPIFPLPLSQRHNISRLHLKCSSPSHSTAAILADDNGNGSSGGGGGGGDRGGGSNSSDDDNDDDGGSNSPPSSLNIGILGLLLNGWRSRVAADPQLPFKLLMEEVVGLTSCVVGDMASRPNFGLNELDFVFSTLVVAAIVNLVLMYVLAPTVATTSSSSSSINIVSSIFSSCPKGHMFESGAYSVLDRFGTFIYKGILFSVVGFAAGLLGTAVSNGLIEVRKKMDPNFETENKAPPTVLNALTWAAHMGLSCNVRYQTLTGVEFLLARCLPPLGFKASVIVLRCVNNIFGGISFVMMARLTGSQKPMLHHDELLLLGDNNNNKSV